jgi:hypothetical protein
MRISAPRLQPGPRNAAPVRFHNAFGESHVQAGSLCFRREGGIENLLPRLLRKPWFLTADGDQEGGLPAELGGRPAGFNFGRVSTCAQGILEDVAKDLPEGGVIYLAVAVIIVRDAAHLKRSLCRKFFLFSRGLTARHFSSGCPFPPPLWGRLRVGELDTRMAPHPALPHKGGEEE